MDYKEISKLFIDYDGDVQINPFAKMHWGILKNTIPFPILSQRVHYYYWGTSSAADL